MEIHQSDLNVFTNCAKKIYYKKVLAIEEPRTAALVTGSAVDKAVYYNLEQKIESKKDLEKEDVIEFFKKVFEEEATEDVNWINSSKEEEYRKGLACVEAYQTFLAPEIIPVATQVEFTLKVPDRDYTIGGTMDHIEIGDVLVDTKTCSDYAFKFSYKQGVVNSTWQFPMYALAFKLLYNSSPNYCEYKVVGKPRKPTDSAKVKTVQGRITQGDIHHLFRAMDSYFKSMNKGVFPISSPDNPLCSKTYCYFWNRCRGRV